MLGQRLAKCFGLVALFQVVRALKHFKKCRLGQTIEREEICFRHNRVPEKRRSVPFSITPSEHREEEMSTLETIKSQIEENPVLLYMKGTPNQPQCGFSSQTVQALMACGRPFSFVNILEHPDIRAELPKYAEWPTFPQLWVNGELVGGCDIVLEMYQSGELKPMVEAASPEASE